MNKEKEIAFEAARAAGVIQRKNLGNIEYVDYKSAFNLVTNVDRECEKAILDLIKSNFPEDQILAEESGEKDGAIDRRWLIDPLDGTTNYSHAYPFFAVSIGLEQEGEMVLGVVYNAVADEMFWAIKGEGAYLNGNALKVSGAGTLAESLLSTGFPPDTRNTGYDNMLEFKTLTSKSHGVRRDGSAALDLCFVAAGRTEGFWEMKLAPWDIGAGSLIVTESGGRVSNLEGGELDINSGHILATNGNIHDEIIACLAELKTKSVG